ncbi:hypothetical protein NUACC21_21730 [Scytonema sp. NUACC21]
MDRMTLNDIGSLLRITRSFLLEEVAPLANEIDCNPVALSHALQGLGTLGLLALRVPRRWNGKEVSEQIYGNFQELIARYSGALAFLQTQHQSAAGMLVGSNNPTLQEKYLPLMGHGQVLLGVGFSQLRRQGKPLVLAVPVSGGFLLNGVVPWVTGWNIFSEFIIAATLPDDRSVFGIVPLVETSQGSGGKIAFSSPAQLAAMTSTNTVTATLTDWFLPAESVVFIKAAGWIHENDKNNVLRATFLATGCALGGLDILEAAANEKLLPFITDAFEALQQELSNCRSEIAKAQQNPGVELAKRLQLRAWAIDLASRISHAAVTVASGAAIYSHHNAQRVYREALVFTVTGQTPVVMEATLKRLTRSQGRQSKTITYTRAIHLSHAIAPGIPQWQGDPQVEFETVAELHKDGYYLRRFSLGEHSATHLNAPNSFYLHSAGIDGYPAESLIVKAVAIDICQQVATNADYVLSVEDILAWEQQHGEIPCHCVVLLYTGWQEKWLDEQEFFNRDVRGGMHFPGFGSDATKFLLQERQIAGVGIDTHGVDSGQDTTFTTNRLILEQPRIVLENLTNLDQLPPTGMTLVIGVLRLHNGSGSPAAVMALIP